MPAPGAVGQPPRIPLGSRVLIELLGLDSPPPPKLPRMGSRTFPRTGRPRPSTAGVGGGAGAACAQGAAARSAPAARTAQGSFLIMLCCNDYRASRSRTGPVRRHRTRAKPSPWGRDRQLAATERAAHLGGMSVCQRRRADRHLPACSAQWAAPAEGQEHCGAALRLRGGCLPRSRCCSGSSAVLATGCSWGETGLSRRSPSAGAVFGSRVRPILENPSAVTASESTGLFSDSGHGPIAMAVGHPLRFCRRCEPRGWDKARASQWTRSISTRRRTTTPPPLSCPSRATSLLEPRPSRRRRSTATVQRVVAASLMGWG